MLKTFNIRTVHYQSSSFYSVFIFGKKIMFTLLWERHHVFNMGAEFAKYIKQKVYVDIKHYSRHG